MSASCVNVLRTVQSIPLALPVWLWHDLGLSDLTDYTLKINIKSVTFGNLRKLITIVLLGIFDPTVVGAVSVNKLCTERPNLSAEEASIFLFWVL